MVHSAGGESIHSIGHLSYNSDNMNGPGSVPVANVGKKSRRKLSARYKKMYTTNTIRTKESIDSESNLSSQSGGGQNDKGRMMMMNNSRGIQQQYNSEGQNKPYSSSVDGRRKNARLSMAAGQRQAEHGREAVRTSMH